MVDNNLVLDIGYSPPVMKRVLIVDDEMALQTLIHDTLEGDYSLNSAYNGRQGIEMAINLKPHVILMDIMMPDIGGYEAIKTLGANDLTKKIPIIVMTAKNFDDSTIREIKNETNVFAFLNKPFRPAGLRDTIKAAIEGRKPAA